MTSVPDTTGARVVVYSTSWCPWCDRAKDLLARRGVPFVEIDGEKLWGDAFREEIERLTGGRTVPQIVIDGKPIGGYADLSEMDARGELKPLAGSGC